MSANNKLCFVGRYDVVKHHALLTNFSMGEVRREYSQARGVPCCGDGGGDCRGCREAEEELPFIHRLGDG